MPLPRPAPCGLPIPFRRASGEQGRHPQDGRRGHARGVAPPDQQAECPGAWARVGEVLAGRTALEQGDGTLEGVNVGTRIVTGGYDWGSQSILVVQFWRICGSGPELGADAQWAIALRLPPPGQGLLPTGIALKIELDQPRQGRVDLVFIVPPASQALTQLRAAVLTPREQPQGPRPGAHWRLTSPQSGASSSASSVSLPALTLGTARRRTSASMARARSGCSLR